ncbi:unnamed protein product [Arctia plantaginis]|uniref:Uncharacterized protein n=1 Tax=Arctia plantaginis TaxID=874455 RepID=A0A8S1B6B8_ARCPL|nr:unnamed protein product [Arctia plantaginis]
MYCQNCNSLLFFLAVNRKGKLTKWQSQRITLIITKTAKPIEMASKSLQKSGMNPPLEWIPSSSEIRGSAKKVILSPPNKLHAQLRGKQHAKPRLRNEHLVVRK